MSFSGVVKEKIARTIGEFFTTNQIVNVFDDANIPTDRELFAKWRIILDAFSKMSDQEAGIFQILEEFCHPLRFQDKETRQNFIDALNKILSYEGIEIQAKDNRVKIVSTSGGTQYKVSKSAPEARTSTDYVIEATNFFKNEYNKVRISGLKYEYFLGEIYSMGNTIEYSDEYSYRLKAIKRLAEAGLITEYTIEEVADDNGIWAYAVCKVDEGKITSKEVPRATDAGVEALAKKVIHEHTHRFESGNTDPTIKMEITKVPELQVRNVEDSTAPKDRKPKQTIELSFPEPVQWEKVTLKIKEGRQEVEIFYDNSHIITADYRQLRFFVGKRQQKPDRQWGFLCALATLAATDIKQATAENMRSMITQNKMLSVNNVQQVKKLLVERFQEIFKTSDDPFHDKRDYYEPKFKILPEPALRREEIWPQGGQLNENLAHEDSEEEAL